MSASLQAEIERGTAEAALGSWCGDRGGLAASEAALVEALHDLARPIRIVRDGARLALAASGTATLGEEPSGDALPLVAFVAPCPPRNLGDRGFREDHGLRYAYVAGAMANGIGSCDVVEAMAAAGMIGFFGAAGLPVDQVETAVKRLSALGTAPHGFNLIHSPNEPHVEAAVADLYVRRGVRLVSASAYLGLTLPLVRYRLHGIHRAPDGGVVAPNRVIAKVSRVEVATRFFSPAPEALVAQLVAAGDLTAEQAQLAREVPVAQDLTAEADSGGHTDNRPALALLPTMIALRDRMQAEHGYGGALRVGAAGGISTPASAAAVYAMGAAYVLTGSVNQSCVEAGTSDAVREMLAAAEQADVAMAPAADMFEMGVKVQVLKRGTMFAMRAARLYQLYRTRSSLEELTPAERGQLEKAFFRAPLADVWRETREFFRAVDPQQIERAESDPQHRMALVFRWYLGKSSHWANGGEPTRRLDYQVWCGPAMGAFNEWVRGSELERPENRSVVVVARNVLHGAAVLTRAQQLRAQGVAVPAAALRTPPLPAAELAERLG